MESRTNIDNCENHLLEAGKEVSSSSLKGIIDLSEIDFAPKWVKQILSHQNQVTKNNTSSALKNNTTEIKEANQNLQSSEKGKSKIKKTDKPTEKYLYGNRQASKKIRIDIHPVLAGIDSLAKQIKAKHRAYPLLELAKIVLQKEERYTITLSVPSQKKSIEEDKHQSANFSKYSIKPHEQPLIYLSAIDNTLWLSFNDAVSHILKNHTDLFYQVKIEKIDPPKGKFTHISVCGYSNTPIAPPNYHGYQTEIRELHSRCFSHIPFDVYKSKIKIVRDENLLQQWINQRSQITIYIPKISNHFSAEILSLHKDCSRSDHLTTPYAEYRLTSKFDDKLRTVVASPQETENISSADDVECSCETVHQPVTKNSEKEKNLCVSKKPHLQQEGSKNPDDSLEGDQKTNSSDFSEVILHSYTEVKEHFIQNFAKQFIKAENVLTIHAGIDLGNSDPAITRRIKDTLSTEQRFPKRIVHNLIRLLHQQGLYFFITRQKKNYVTGTPPRQFTAEEGAVKENIQEILNFIRRHPSCNRRQLFEALLPEFRLISEANMQQTDMLTTSTNDSPEQQVLTTKGIMPKAITILKDLHWLIRQGHIIEFATGELELYDPKKHLNFNLNSQKTLTNFLCKDHRSTLKRYSNKKRHR